MNLWKIIMEFRDNLNMTQMGHWPAQNSLFAAIVGPSLTPFGGHLNNADAFGAGEGQVTTGAVQVEAYHLEEGCISQDQGLEWDSKNCK